MIDEFLEPQSHASASLMMASEALMRGDTYEAFKFIDRHCRLARVADPNHLIFRAEALHKLGEKEFALRDIMRALDILPESVEANRRLMLWGDAGGRLAAARSLIGVETNLAALTRALRLVFGAGELQVMALSRQGDSASGWVAWTGHDPLSLRVSQSGQSQTHEIVPMPRHPLAGAVDHVATIAVPMSEPDQGYAVEVVRSGNVVLKRRFPPLVPKVLAERTLAPNEPFAAPDQVTIIIPAYKNLKLTRSCIESAQAQSLPDQGNIEIVIVNDASPDPALSAYLTTCGLFVLQNDENLGFAGSVNRALRMVSDGDVLLLNSDTELPPGAVERLYAVAHSAPDIATVTPLSNNGELTSFPIPFVDNPMPDRDTALALDRIAEGREATNIIDLPNGVGFCLYITRPCLEALGEIPEIYERGYYEDVHFCLDARRLGFRNVCAPNVFVAHAGAQSFGADKRALVVRNLARLEAHFPECRAETAAFMRADPLMSVRARLELESMRGADAVVALARYEDIRTILPLLVDDQQDGTPLVVLERDEDMLRLHVSRGPHRISSNLEFNVLEDSDRIKIREILRGLKIRRAIVTNPCAVPEWLESIFADTHIVPDVFLLGATCDPKVGSCCTRSQCGDNQRQGCDRWQSVVGRASRILCPDATAEAFAHGLSPNANIVSTPLTDVSQRPNHGPNSTAFHLAIVPLDSSRESFGIIASVTAHFSAEADSPSVIVLGSTADDLAIMRNGGTFVTGAVPPDEVRLLLRRHDIKCAALISARPVFGHPMRTELESIGLPLAVIDWSNGGAMGGTLGLAPGLDGQALARQLLPWCQKKTAG